MCDLCRDPNQPDGSGDEPIILAPIEDTESLEAVPVRDA